MSMTTQPSDWAVAQAFWNHREEFYRLYGMESGVSNIILERARELDASGAEPTDALIDAAQRYAHQYEADDRQDIVTDVTNAFFQGAHYQQHATPRAAEAGEWLPIESAPDDIGLCVVYTPDQGDGERFDIDWKEDGVWQEHYNHFEHFMAVGGVNACGPDVVCTGPGEQPEYTHYRPMKAPRAAMGAVGAGGGE